MPNFSMRLRSVARVMPSSFAAWTWLLFVSLSAWMTSSRSTAGMAALAEVQSGQITPDGPPGQPACQFK